MCVLGEEWMSVKRKMKSLLRNIFVCVCVERGVDVSEREDEIYGKGGR